MIWAPLFVKATYAISLLAFSIFIYKSFYDPYKVNFFVCSICSLKENHLVSISFTRLSRYPLNNSGKDGLNHGWEFSDIHACAHAPCFAILLYTFKPSLLSSGPFFVLYIVFCSLNFSSVEIWELISFVQLQLPRFFPSLSTHLLFLHAFALQFNLHSFSQLYVIKAPQCASFILITQHHFQCTFIQQPFSLEPKYSCFIIHIC